MDVMYYLKIKIPNTIYRIAQLLEILVSFFAISRQMIIEHTTPVENLLMVAAIAALFLIRKFLVLPGLDAKQTLTVPRSDDPHENLVGRSKN